MNEKNKDLPDMSFTHDIQEQPKKTGFSKYDLRHVVHQDFNLDKITFPKAGKPVKITDYLESGRTDTEIYPTLAKYNQNHRFTQEQMADAKVALYGDMGDFDNLGTFLQRKKEIEQLWNEQPIEIRREFGNDIERFVREGHSWAEKEVKKRAEQKAKEEEARKKLEEEAKKQIEGE